MELKIKDVVVGKLVRFATIFDFAIFTYVISDIDIIYPTINRAFLLICRKNQTREKNHFQSKVTYFIDYTRKIACGEK